jgi:hypothetical protein
VRIKGIFKSRAIDFAYTPMALRVKRIFLFFPLLLQDELRWLEWANIIQVNYRDEWICVKFTELEKD